MYAVVKVRVNAGALRSPISYFQVSASVVPHLDLYVKR